MAAFGRDKTFMVEATVNDRAVGRRSVRPWGGGRWFLELMKRQCKRLGISEEDRVRLSLAAAPDTPADLTDRIEAAGLGAQWLALSEVQRRSIAESVFEAKRDSTRRTRIEKAISMLRARRQVNANSPY